MNESFGKRLSACMEIADVSNVNLAKKLHMDPSLLSRIRNDSRSFRNDPDIRTEACRYLIRHAEEANRLPELMELISANNNKERKTAPAQGQGLPQDTVDKAEEDPVSMLYHYLFDQKDFERKALTDLLQTIHILPGGLLSPKDQSSPLHIPDIPEKNHYIGIEGFRQAVVRFLCTVKENKIPNLYLFSDESMDWLTEDPSFSSLWAFLMTECIRNGTKIHIIHHITRNVTEMTTGVQKWLPLYMTNSIRSFYLKDNEDKYFSHTVFLAPGVACVRGWHPKGNEKNAIYHYETDEGLLSYYENGYRILLEKARPLLEVRFNKEEQKAPPASITVSRKAAVVTSQGKPSVSFIFYHPLMRGAIAEYAASLPEEDHIPE